MVSATGIKAPGKGKLWLMLIALLQHMMGYQRCPVASQQTMLL